jgi:hypothetical protein
MRGKTVVCHSEELIGELCDKARQLRLDAVKIIHRKGLGHLYRLRTFANRYGSKIKRRWC